MKQVSERPPRARLESAGGKANRQVDETAMQLREDDILGEQSPTQRFEFRKSLALGAVAVVGGIVLLVIGLVEHRNVTVPAFAIVTGVLILGSTSRTHDRVEIDLRDADPVANALSARFADGRGLRVR